MKILPVIIAFLLLLAPAADADKSSRTVYADNYVFVSSVVQIKKGQSIRWVFRQGSHNVVGKGWGQKTPKSSGSYSKRFRSPGNYSYVCTLHPGMKGLVRVRR